MIQMYANRIVTNVFGFYTVVFKSDAQFTIESAPLHTFVETADSENVLLPG